ncbi:hypothetical protein CC78DRAFT_528389 [Lojkania enalia]|uniref:Uncharacterized protein n=1 Tax=Lojkania enalia TaxID=147567 RepID=A0A9P4NCC0_9PLEO|nr:hypothetical protein CC78DRAFT_528389 [Didymosphaeria enalia]
MYQRHIGPTMGALQRPLTREISVVYNCVSRNFHISARRLEDSRSNPPSEPNDAAQRESRRERLVKAYKQVAGLQRRGVPGRAGTAGGVSPNNTPKQTSIRMNASSQDASTNNRPMTGRPLIRKTAASPSSPLLRKEALNPSEPPGTMVRAPSTLRITRNARGPNMGGPNLRGRDRPKSASNRGGEMVPRARQKKRDGTKTGSGSGSAREDGKEESHRIEDSLSDAMVQQLLRLQRKMWDRKPYEPKYAHGSPAALELIEAGKRLFEGEKPKKKTIPGKLERTIGIVGMHGA